MSSQQIDFTIAALPGVWFKVKASGAIGQLISWNGNDRYVLEFNTLFGLTRELYFSWEVQEITG